jgi:energy-converting hydrogenase B subunit D
MLEPVNLILLGMLLVTGITASVIRSLLGAVIAYSLYSLFMCLMWQRLQAPDLALTEAAVGGITTVLLVVTVFKTRGKVK